jgi:flagellar basal body rod protein FlgF
MTTTWKVRSTRASQPSNPDPIKMRAGDHLEVTGEEEDGWIWCRHQSGKESWVPLSLLRADQEGASRIALADYDATELPVAEGEEFRAMLEEHGWLWCETTEGQLGWVRLAQVERLAEA